MPDLRNKLFELLGIEAWDNFELYDKLGTYRGDYHITDSLVLIPNNMYDLSDSCISIIAILRGDFEIVPLPEN